MFVGFFAAFVQAGIYPAFGIFFAKILFAMMRNDEDSIRDGVEENALYMFLIAITSFFSTFFLKA